MVDLRDNPLIAENVVEPLVDHRELTIHDESWQPASSERFAHLLHLEESPYSMAGRSLSRTTEVFRGKKSCVPCRIGSLVITGSEARCRSDSIGDAYQIRCQASGSTLAPCVLARLRGSRVPLGPHSDSLVRSCAGDVLPPVLRIARSMTVRFAHPPVRLLSWPARPIEHSSIKRSAARTSMTSADFSQQSSPCKIRVSPFFCPDLSVDTFFSPR